MPSKRLPLVLAAIISLFFCAAVASAQCPGGVCRYPQQIVVPVPQPPRMVPYQQQGTVRVQPRWVFGQWLSPRRGLVEWRRARASYWVPRYVPMQGGQQR